MIDNIVVIGFMVNGTVDGGAAFIYSLREEYRYNLWIDEKVLSLYNLYADDLICKLKANVIDFGKNNFKYCLIGEELIINDESESFDNHLSNYFDSNSIVYGNQ